MIVDSNGEWVLKVSKMASEIAELKAEITELKRQLELAKSDALVRPCSAPGFNHHQGGGFGHT